jgi:hypothetical protein
MMQLQHFVHVCGTGYYRVTKHITMYKGRILEHLQIAYLYLLSLPKS